MTPRSLTALVSLVMAMSVAAFGAVSAQAESTETIVPAPEVTTSPTTPTSTTPSTATTTVPAPPTPEPAPATPSTTTTTPETTTTQTNTTPAPEVQTQLPQPASGARGHHIRVKAPSASTGRQSGKGVSHGSAASPSSLTPPLPSALGTSLSGVPSFFINSFSIPPFLLPIYQAAGAAYGIPWQVLAAINEVETDYGRDLSVSSAGAEGWMQFLPSTWGQYGVDVNDNGFEDPYNPADAIFAAARYLKAAGGAKDIRAAVFSYNHSQAYVNSVMLRARLLGGTPPELLGAITGLTEARFPVYAPSHYSDGFPTTEGPSPKRVAATTIYSQTGAPVIAVQDGRIVQIGQTGPLGRTISLQDAYGNTYTYSGLGTLATLYPVLEASPRASTANPVPSGAGARTATRVFRAGSDNVYLHPLRVGVQVIAGTVLGHVGNEGEPHIVFQIRPNGIGAPLIDPKPILDGWVKLQSTSVVKAKGSDPFATISPTPGQALLESKAQLEQQLPHERNVHLASCERRLVEEGRVDRRVLAALEYLAASGLNPTVSGHGCSQASTTTTPLATTARDSSGESFDLTAVDGIPVIGPDGPASLAVTAVQKLRRLQGVMKPLQIVSSASIAGVTHSAPIAGDADLIRVAYTPLGGARAHAAAGVFTPGLSPQQWLALVDRLGQVPDPAVSTKPSSAAIPDHSGVGPSSTTTGGN